MTPEQCRAAQDLLGLKAVKRAGWTRYLPDQAVESVADHSFGVALLCWLFCPPELDRARVLELALIHDLAEVITGDMTPQNAPPAALKAEQEQAALKKLMMPLERRARATELLSEYQRGETPESRWVRVADKLEMTLQSRRYESQYGKDLSEFRESSRERLAEFGLDWVAHPE